MTDETDPPNVERSLTDESLRAERELADDVLSEDIVTVEDTADAVVELARSRADAVLAAAREASDLPESAETGGARGDVQEERAREDLAIGQARAAADEALRRERAEQLITLAAERAETNRDLSSERARADLALTRRDEFLIVVSHELRNMLSAIGGFATVIEQGADPGPSGNPVRSHARRILRSSARMNHLIGDLIDVASIEAGTLTMVRRASDPRRILGEAVETFQALAATQGVTLTAEMPPSLAKAAVDPARILQVLANLLGNAIKFTPASGTVTARVEAGEGEVRFGVSDTGPGIPADKLETVFERSVQVAQGDRRGLGLGLYIARGIVLGHGGTIWAESAPGHGTTVRFALPLAAGG